MADPDLVWDETAFRVSFTDGIGKNLAAAGRLVRDEAKQVVGIQGAPLGKRKKNPKTNRRVQLRVPSQPGEPPHKWTGRLQRGIRSKVNKGKTKVQIIARGGNLMEFGTRTVKARPFLRPTLAKMKTAIHAVLTTPIVTK